MTGAQYKNTINWTVEQIENNTSDIQTAIDVFKNTGTALPHGNHKEILSTLLQDNYMLWEEVSRAEAQEAANNGIATVGVSNNKIIVIKPEEEEEDNLSINNPYILSIPNLSIEEMSGMNFFTYTASRKKGSGGGSTEEKESTLDKIKNKFPNGKYWNHVGMDYNNPDGYTNSKCPSHNSVATCNSFYGNYQCLGFSHRCGYEATGSVPSQKWPRYTGTEARNYFNNQLKPGDILNYYSSASSSSYHSIYVTGVSNNIITYGDCNGQQDIYPCRIRWDVTKTRSEILERGIESVRKAPKQLDV